MFFRAVKIKFIILTLMILSMLTIVNILGIYFFMPGMLKEEKVVIVQPNLSIHEIARLLNREGVIGNQVLFKMISKIYSCWKPLKSGEYLLTSHISPYQILLKLSSGKSILHTVLIPEGYSIYQILEVLKSETKLKGVVEEKIPEGYLMPSKYSYSYGDHRKKIIEMMSKNMSLALDKVMMKLDPASPLKTRSDVLILASIIEKESNLDSERKKIAAVFLNRLKRKMRLQTDPTVLYAITEGRYDLGRPLTRSDLKTDNIYNTYKIGGLPPGAISCPGVAALEAVVDPAKTEDLYFVGNGRGGHNFAKTYKEHKENINKLRRWREANKKSKN